jgi:ectoine hydroxylase-related dioxygenase (phytanoyl-CoA dioxygenase family)
VLTNDERKFFWDNGYVGPFRAMSAEAMGILRDQILSRVLGAEPSLHGTNNDCRHLDSHLVHGLCAQPAIVDRMADLLGQNLILWRSYFWCKQPGSPEVPWHQDLNNWPLEPMVNISAWVALDRVTVQNSCLSVIPGSHKRVHRAVPIDYSGPVTGYVEDEHIDLARAINIELEPGEFFLFSEKLLHYSPPNQSAHRRLALAIRVTVPFVKVSHDQLFPGHRNVVLRGVDEMGFNLLQQPGSPL